MLFPNSIYVFYFFSRLLPSFPPLFLGEYNLLSRAFTNRKRYSVSISYASQLYGKSYTQLTGLCNYVYAGFIVQWNISGIYSDVSRVRENACWIRWYLFCVRRFSGILFYPISFLFRLLFICLFICQYKYFSAPTLQWYRGLAFQQIHPDIHIYTHAHMRQPY